MALQTALAVHRMMVDGFEQLTVSAGCTGGLTEQSVSRVAFTST
ncbi:hypothetical protein [Streptomyces hydrogenans]